MPLKIQEDVFPQLQFNDSFARISWLHLPFIQTQEVQTSRWEMGDGGLGVIPPLLRGYNHQTQDLHVTPSAPTEGKLRNYFKEKAEVNKGKTF